MAYKVYLNNDILIFDTSLQDDEILMTRAVANITAQGSGSFDFTIPSCHKYYGQFQKLKDYIDVYRDDELIFAGRVYSITDTMDGQQSVSCEGLLSILADSVYIPETYQGKLRDLVRRILDTHNAQVGSDKAVWLGSFTVDNVDVYRDYQDYETSISRLSDLVKTFGGYMMLRKNYDPEHDGTIDVGLIDVGYVDVGVKSYYLDWFDHFIEPCTQKIELASNLLDVRQVQTSSDIATVILPLGARQDDGTRLTIESVNAGSKVITADAESIAQYGYVVKVNIWDDVTVASNLKTKAQAYLQACLTPKTEISLSAVDLADAGYDVDSFRVGQMVTVKAPQIGPEAVQFECVKQMLNLLQPAQNKLDLGSVRLGYVQSQIGNTSEKIMMEVVERIENSENVMQQAIDQATAMITGNEGGYVVLHDGDGDGYPDEILVMDTADIETAVNVWRWNKNGLGYSDRGYGGPYTSAWTIDGHFNADFITVGSLSADLITTGALNASLITTGTMNADRIRAGILRAQTGNSYWNLNSGEMNIIGDLVLQKEGMSVEIGTITTYTMDIIGGRVIIGEAAGFKTSRNTIPDKSYFAICPYESQWSGSRATGGKSSVLRWLAQPTNSYGNGSSFDDQSIVSMSGSSYKFIHEQYHDSMYNYRITRLGSNFEFTNVLFSSMGFGIKSDGSIYFAFGDGQVLSPTPSKGFWYENSKFYVNGSQVQFASTSSRRYKKDINPLNDSTLDPHKLLDLQAVQFRYKEAIPLQYDDMKDQLIPGFIAEDVEQIYPAATIRSDLGEVESWDERRIIPGMLIQEQHAEIEQLKTEVSELKEMIKKLL